MAGQTKKLLEQIIALKSNNDPVMRKLTTTKLLVKGIRVEHFSDTSEDDPIVLQKVRQIAQDFGLQLIA